MKKIKVFGYNLYYIGKEKFNNNIWYHCILVNEYNEVELLIDYKLDEAGRFYNLFTRPIKDFIMWNIGQECNWIRNIINKCDTEMKLIAEELGDLKNDSETI